MAALERRSSFVFNGPLISVLKISFFVLACGTRFPPICSRLPIRDQDGVDTAWLYGSCDLLSPGNSNEFPTTIVNTFILSHSSPNHRPVSSFLHSFIPSCRIILLGINLIDSSLCYRAFVGYEAAVWKDLGLARNFGVSLARNCER